jgi:hypothetical protein
MSDKTHKSVNRQIYVTVMRILNSKQIKNKICFQNSLFRATLKRHCCYVVWTRPKPP